MATFGLVSSALAQNAQSGSRQEVGASARSACARQFGVAQTYGAEVPKAIYVPWQKCLCAHGMTSRCPR
jgi:hypothetical protein